MTEKMAYSIAEAAATLSLSRSQVKELVYQRRLKSLRVGRRVLVPHWAVVEFLSSAGASSTEPDGGWDKVLEGI